MSKWIITILASSLLFTSYFAYNCWQDEKTAKKEQARLTAIITDKEAQYEYLYQKSAQTEIEKQQLESESQERQGQINELLKNNKCANELVPNDVANKLYQRANSLRQSTKTTNQPN